MPGVELHTKQVREDVGDDVKPANDDTAHCSGLQAGARLRLGWPAKRPGVVFRRLQLVQDASLNVEAYLEHHCSTKQPPAK